MDKALESMILSIGTQELVREVGAFVDVPAKSDLYVYGRVVPLPAHSAARVRTMVAACDPDAVAAGMPPAGGMAAGSPPLDAANAVQPYVSGTAAAGQSSSPREARAHKDRRAIRVIAVLAEVVQPPQQASAGVTAAGRPAGAALPMAVAPGQANPAHLAAPQATSRHQEQ